MDALTAREEQVARLVATGLANRQIAQRLSISVQTVKNHIQSVYRKLHLNNRVQLSLRVFPTSSRKDSPVVHGSVAPEE
jgi:DNA-binding NarL/FixJ family response regulator